jgi:hypothetical protein
MFAAASWLLFKTMKGPFIEYSKFVVSDMPFYIKCAGLKNG